MQRDDGLTYGRAMSERKRERWHDPRKKKTKKKTKKQSLSSPSVSPHSSLHGDNWISRRLILVCAGCRRDIPTADGRVSFGGGSEARWQKWDFHSFSVKLPLTPSDNKPGEALDRLGKAAWGYAGLWGEEAAAVPPVNRIPLFQLLLIPKVWRVWRVRFQMILADKRWWLQRGSCFTGTWRGPSHLITGSLWSRSLQVRGGW